jgi:cathepsin A (carboxypeptidase C)
LSFKGASYAFLVLPIAPIMIGLLSAWLASLTLITYAAASDIPPPAATSGISPNGHAFTIRKQNASLCDAGSTQWTGTVKVSPEKSIFFCKWYESGY